jgi:hypothetical protein
MRSPLGSRVPHWRWVRPMRHRVDPKQEADPAACDLVAAWTRTVRRHETKEEAPTVTCPGCGGHGRFAWSRDDTIPRQWSWDASCGLCDGRGRIPSAWLRDTSTVRSV